MKPGWLSGPLLLGGLCLALVACSSPPEPLSAEASPPPETASSTLPSPLASPSPDPAIVTPDLEGSGHGATPTSAATPPQQTVSPGTQYTLTALLDYTGRRVEVQQIISYHNQSGEPLAELVLLVPPNNYPGAFILGQINWMDGAPLEAYHLEGIELVVPLDPFLMPDGTIQLSLIYQLNVPDRSGAFGYTATQINLGDWYPIVPPYRPGAGWLIHQPWANGEYLVYSEADFAVNLQLTEPTLSGVPLTVAASAPVEIDGDWRRYRLAAARNFALSVSPYFHLVEREVEGWTVLSYFFQEHQSAGQAAAQVAAESLDLFSERFGPYPHQTLSLVEASFGDGMEYAGLVFLSQGFYFSYDGTPNNYLTLLAAHETAHQWWYGLVGSDQALEPWLDEALCTYSEVLYYERYHPQSLDWWWLFRVNVYGPQGWVNGTIYDFNAFRPYVNAVYLRGAQFLDQLRGQMGEAAFDAFLRDYASQFAHREATGEDFFELLVNYTPGDISPLMAAFFPP